MKPMHRFDSAGLPLDGIAALWGHVAAIEGVADRQLSISTTLWRLGTVAVGSGCVSAVRAIRSPAQNREGESDGYALLLSTRGEWIARPGIRRHRMAVGQVLVLDLGCSWEIECADEQFIVLLLPRPILQSLSPGAPRLHGRALRSPLAGMLADHLVSLADKLPRLRASDAEAMELALLNFVGSAINRVPKDSFLPRTIPVDTREIAARVARAIEERLTDPDLSADKLCVDLRISRNDLTQTLGSVSRVESYIRGRRLEAARALVVGSVIPPSGNELAQMFCFSSGDEFDKAFARYFGCGPAAARTDGRLALRSTARAA